MARSVLLHGASPVEAPRAVLIGLHDHGESEEQGLRLARALDPSADAFAPRGMRHVSPRYHESRGGYDAHLWYAEYDGVVDPPLFGDALRQLEAFLFDVLERDSRYRELPLRLAGRGQGGSLALALTLLWPELVNETVAIDAGLPNVPGWKPPTEGLEGTRVRLVTEGAPPSADRLKATVGTLQRAGAEVVRKAGP